MQNCLAPTNSDAVLITISFNNAFKIENVVVPSDLAFTLSKHITLTYSESRNNCKIYPSFSRQRHCLLTMCKMTRWFQTEKQMRRAYFKK